MNRGSRLWRAALALALTVSAPLWSPAQEPDDATRRARAREEWYHESYQAPARDKRTRKGGPWSAEYRRFVLDAAARERAKWGALIPGNPDAATVAEPEAAVAASGTNWVSLGPTKADFLYNFVTLNVTDTGRVRSFVTHPSDPNVLLVAFSGGGVWKTADGGVSWRSLTESLGSLSIGWLAADPGNSNVLYLGLGDPFDGTGIGLVKSTDGGHGWSKPVFLGDSQVTTQVMVAPADSKVVLATTDRGLFRSVNAGATFKPVALPTGRPEVPYGWSIEWTGGSSFVVAAEADPFALSGTTDGMIFVSANNGASWTRAAGVAAPGGVGRITVAAAPSNRRIVYAVASNFGGSLADYFKSVDGGANWTALRATAKNVRYQNPTPSTMYPAQLFNGQGWYDQMAIVHPANPNVVDFGGALHNARTTDGGRTWRITTDWLGQYGLPYVHADTHAAAYDAAGAFLFGTDGGIFRSTDGGGTFSDALNVGIVTHLIYNLGSSPASPSAVIGGMQDNGTRVRSGDTSIFNQTIGGDGFGCDIHPRNGKLVLGSLYNTRIQKSNDGGLTFGSATAGISEAGTGAAPFFTKVVPWAGDESGNTVYTFVNARAYRSTNYAQNWSPLGTAGLPASGLFLRNMGVAKSNGSILGLVANGGRVFLSNNGGASWFAPAPLPNHGLSLSDVWFDTTDPNIVYVASVAPSFSVNHLWKSTDFGASWTTIDGGDFPAGVPVNVVRNDPSNPGVIYAGTHLGVYRSTDRGASWTRFGSGLPLVEVTDLYLSSDSTLMRAATFGRGFWELAP
ncbi:MAG TPA: hypothetical protein VIG50_09385 [Vicinamibacteria bacterium]